MRGIRYGPVSLWGAGDKLGEHMKRRLICFAAAVAALVPIVGLAQATPAQSYEVVSVCITITEKFVGFEVNGIPFGAPIGPYPRTCIGI